MAGQLLDAEESVIKEGVMVSKFLDIYENSFE